MIRNCISLKAALNKLEISVCKIKDKFVKLGIEFIFVASQERSAFLVVLTHAEFH